MNYCVVCTAASDGRSIWQAVAYRNDCFPKRFVAARLGGNAHDARENLRMTIRDNKFRDKRKLYAAIDAARETERTVSE